MIFGAACLVGMAQHFLYEPLGRPAALRWLLPTAESPWEHFKLAFWPLCAALALWGGLQGAAAGTILCACCLGASHAFCTMMGIYFFYRAALGVKRPVLWADIGNFYVTMLLGWRLGLRALGGSRRRRWRRRRCWAGGRYFCCRSGKRRAGRCLQTRRP